MMRYTLLNQLEDSRCFILLKFDEVFETPPYIKRPVRFWMDTPKGRIQMTGGSCEDYSCIIDSTTYVAICDMRLAHNAYEKPNDFVLNLIESFDIDEDTQIHKILTELGISELQLDVFKDKEEIQPIRPSEIWCSINGCHFPIKP